VKKENAIEHAKRGHGASDWIENTIRKKFEELPIVTAPTLREKAIASAAAVREESLTEVEILQKIIVRENLLSELQKLLQFQVDLDGILSEVDEMIRAIRYQTLEVIEEIGLWKSDSKAPRQFYYRGQNYLLKLLTDTSFLDEYDDLGDHYGFYFTGNPLFYDGIVQRANEFSASHGCSMNQTNNPTSSPLQLSHNTNTLNSDDDLDGIQLYRLHDAELLLQNETNFFQNSSSSIPQISVDNTPVDATQSNVLHIGEANFSIVDNATSFPNQGSTSLLDNQKSSFAHHRESPSDGNKRRSPDGTLKPVKVLNELKSESYFFLSPLPLPLPCLPSLLLSS
jgi:hypothetical protein